MSQQRPTSPRQPRNTPIRGAIGGSQKSQRENFLQRRRAQERAEAQAAQSARARPVRPLRRRRTSLGQKVMLIATIIFGILLVVSFVLPYLGSPS